MAVSNWSSWLSNNNTDEHKYNNSNNTDEHKYNNSNNTDEHKCILYFLMLGLKTYSQKYITQRKKIKTY